MNKKVIIGVVVALLLGIGGFLYTQTRGANKEVAPTVMEEQTDVIPTVDASTKVDITSNPGGKEVELRVEGLPTNTTSVDYELSYQTVAQGTQGVIGTVSDFKNNGFTKDITLGTCSSGRCVYHELDGPLNIVVKFYGYYGEKVFENKFEL